MMKRQPLLYCCLLAVYCIVCAPPVAAQNTLPAEDTPYLYVIGDSTAASYDQDRYPLTGWAQVMQTYFDPEKLMVHDKARSGRSSKSFMEEGAWTEIRENLRQGDYVLIQFGHNDSKQDDPKRYTDPKTTYLEYLNTYIDETLAKGATPILVTSINRNSWENNGTFKDTMGSYPDAVRTLATERNVALIDAHRLTRELLENLGREKATAMFMNLAPGIWPNYPEGSNDNTHLQEAGAHAICKLIVQSLTKLGGVFKDAAMESFDSTGEPASSSSHPAP